MSADTSQNQSTAHNIHANSLANLRPWQPGESANPGGKRANAPRTDVAYQKLSAMKTKDLRDYEPNDACEDSVKNCILRACDADDWQKAHAAIKELSDRLDGKAAQTKNINITVDLRSVQIEALLLLYANLTREQVIERGVAQVDAIYAVTDGEGRREVILAQLDESDEELGAFWSQAEDAVKGK